ncbi:MAG: binding-protein-dependent transport system inner rane component [Conexibacter sp.]|jgi:osmoprotectant transport system permease protein|nr:binding-protein-dependent transport system inner rane component [Conexibacter sp.]
MNDFVDGIKFIGDNSGLLWHLTIKHLELTGAAVGIALLIALPIGIWLGHLHRGSFVAISISNVGRALPTLALISFGVAILGIGFLNSMIALVILAVPPVLTNAYVAVEGVDRDAVEAAEGMGMTPLEVLLRVELPLALPLIFAGIRIAVVFVIATATIASVAGGTGLGDIIVDQATYRLPGVIGASICVAVLALLAQLLFALLQRAITPRGLRVQKVRPGRPESAAAVPVITN